MIDIEKGQFTDDPEKKHKKFIMEKYIKQRKETDAFYKLQLKYRDLLNNYIKSNTNKNSHIIGCTSQQLREHIQSQFKDGMTWDNRGDWELDHIIPISSCRKEEELIKVSHYTNLQPLWKEENRKKG